MENQTISISTQTILKIILLLIGIWLLWMLKEVIFILFVTLIIVVTLLPVVDKLQEKKVPRPLAVILLYLILVVIMAGLLLLIIPPLVVQIKELAQNFPGYIEKLTPTFQSIRNFYQEPPAWVSFFQKPLENLSQKLTGLSGSIFSTAKGVFSGLGMILTILVLTFYSLLDKKGLTNLWHHFIPSSQRDKVNQILEKVFTKWGNWVRGQIALVLIVGLADFIGLTILGIPYALTLGVLAGVFEIIPYVGPVLAIIPAVVVAFFISPWKALFVLILYILIQQLESNILVPKIMEKAVGLSPIIIILALLAGVKLGGILGVMVAVPVAVGLITFIQEWQKTNL